MPAQKPFGSTDERFPPSITMNAHSNSSPLPYDLNDPREMDPPTPRVLKLHSSGHLLCSIAKGAGIAWRSEGRPLENPKQQYHTKPLLLPETLINKKKFLFTISPSSFAAHMRPRNLLLFPPPLLLSLSLTPLREYLFPSFKVDRL